MNFNKDKLILDIRGSETGSTHDIRMWISCFVLGSFIASVHLPRFGGLCRSILLYTDKGQFGGGGKAIKE